MSEFKTPLEVRMLPEADEQNWVLTAPLVYQSDVMGVTITVPAGFVTDFVSFEPLKHLGQRPAVVHDYLYSCPDVERGIADDVLREALESVGINHLLAWDMFIAVRLFGASHKAKERN